MLLIDEGRTVKYRCVQLHHDTHLCHNAHDISSIAIVIPNVLPTRTQHHTAGFGPSASTAVAENGGGGGGGGFLCTPC